MLPISTPRFTTFHFLANAGIIMSANPALDNWYLNNTMQLKCKKDLHTHIDSPLLNICTGLIWDVPTAKHFLFDRCFIKYCFHDIIVAFLEQGYYVTFDGVDDYYVEGKSWYGDRHYAHDGLIYGVDDEKGIYHIAAYDKRWVYSFFETSQKGFAEGFLSPQIPENQVNLIGVTVDPNASITLDVPQIKAGLENYLRGYEAPNAPDADDFVYGIMVYERLRAYLQALGEDTVTADRRVFRMLLENKKCMKDRLAAAEHERGIPEISSCEYDAVIQLTEEIHFLYGKYLLQRKTDLLTDIDTRIELLQNKEKECLTGFCETI